MASQHAGDALRKLASGQGIDSGELDALLGERLIVCRDDGKQPPHHVVTDLGNSILFGTGGSDGT